MDEFSGRLHPTKKKISELEDCLEGIIQSISQRQEMGSRATEHGGEAGQEKDENRVI